MNKNLYRIIFSKARNMFIVVGENSKSKTKAAGKSAKIAISPGTQDSQILQQHWVVKSLVASMSLWMSVAPVYSQIQADPAANVANRPVVGVGKNSQGQNVPVVNIQTPVNGVSHNIYKQMDVLSNGVVLNNSRTGAGSITVGNVGANPFLAKGEARLILNEINSTAATRFEGNLEIAGQRADVIIANPAGINIKGGGFINANKAIFTTGKAQLNADGSLKQFVVDQGKVTVTANTGSTLGLGGNNNNADYVDIYARALDLNAKMHANQDINVITGANTISANLESIDSKTSTVAAPALAVDIKSLGGMYANNIFLMGNEKGLGVTNAGTLQAVNNIVVTNTGKIVHSGTISTTDKKNGLVSVASTGTGAAADIAISGSVNSYGLINIDSGNNLNLNAKDITLNYDATTLNSAALIIGAQGNLNLATGTKINNLSTNGDLYIDAKGISLAANSELRSNRGSANINANESLLSNSTARLIAAKDLNLTANKDLKLIGNTLQATSGSINIQSAEEAHLLQVDGGTLYAGKDLNIYGTGDVSLKNLSFNLVNNATRLKNINVYSGKNLIWDNKAKPLAKISGKLQLEAKQGIELSGTALHAANGIAIQSDTLNLNTTVKSDQGIDFTTLSAMSLAQGTALNAVRDVKLASLQGSIQAQSLKVNSTTGHTSIIAHENVNLNSVQTTVPMSHADRDEQITDKTVIDAAQGIVLASAEKGTVSVNSADLTTAKGDLKILGQNGVNLDSNIDVVVGGGDNGYDTILSNQLKGQSVSIGTKKGNIDIKNTDLTSTVNQLHLNSEAGMLNVADSKLQSKGNTEIYAKDILALKNITANSDQHLAVNSKRTLYLNADYTPTATVWHPSAKTNLTAKGVLSLTATGNQIMQNAQMTGGAILLETTNLSVKPGLVFNATGSDLLKKDTNLNSLNGDLSILTRGANGLNIDPKIIKLSAVGDIELIAKNGLLKLVGYGGTQGKGSEQVVKLNTAGGGINLQGDKVELQGSKLTASKDLSIVSTGGDLIVDGVRNTITNQHTDEYKARINSLINQEKLLFESDDYKDFMAFLMQELTTLGKRVESGELVAGGEAVWKEVEKILIIGTKQYPNYVSKAIRIREEKDFYSEMLELFNVGYVNGEVHTGTEFISEKGNIQVVSNKGLSISGSSIDAKDGKVSLEAAGTLDGDGYNIQGKYNNPIENSVKKGVIKGSIVIDANQDSYEQGKASDNNYRWYSPVSPTIINGTKGVSIKATGKQATDNLVLQGVSITSENDVNIEAYKNIIFDVAINNSFNKSQKTETKRKWYGKKKTITTTQTDEKSGGLSVDIDAKNINIKSQEKNTASMTGQNRTSIDMYSSQLNAIDGKINIQAGGDLNFLTADDVTLSTTDITKKSSFLGVKLNNSHTTKTRNVKSELPSELNANYIGTKSGFDTRLKGTVFNYLEGANIEAGGNITLEGASKTVAETLKKESNSVVWQSMQDKGSITETAKLPSFNGPVAPTFIAKGGLTVQVPVISGQNNDVRAEVIKLSNQPGNEYLKGLIARKDVNWEAVKLAQESWDYKSQGLTGAGAALIVIIVTIATMGSGTAAAAGAAGGAAASGTTVGLGASMIGAAGVTTTAAGVIVPSTLGAMANAAVTSLLTQASISTINNGGDLSKTLKDLGSKESVKSLATSVVTAGLLSEVSSALKLKPNSTALADKMTNTFVNSTGSALIQSAVNGGDLKTNLEKALLSGFVSVGHAGLSQLIGSNIDGFTGTQVEFILHKIAHAAAGCVAAAAQKAQCEAGAIGAAVGETVAGVMLNQNKQFNSVDEVNKYFESIAEYSQLAAGLVVAYAGYKDVAVAANAAEVAVKNNALMFIPAALEGLATLTAGSARLCATNPVCRTKAAQIGVDVLAMVAINSGKPDNESVQIVPLPSTSGSSATGMPPNDPDHEDKWRENKTDYTSRLNVREDTARTELRSNLPGSGGQAHHIIPWQLRTNPLVQKASKGGFNINGAENGVRLSNHRGPHQYYSIRIENYLNNVNRTYPNMTNEEAAKYLVNFNREMRVTLRNMDKKGTRLE